MNHQTVRPLSRARAWLPSPFGWKSGRAAALNLLVFDAAVLFAVWIVHQVEYLIEYRGQFSVVMSTTPHRYYMDTTGIALLVGAVAVTLAMTIVALSLGRGVKRSRGALPTRIGGRIEALLPAADLGVLAPLAGALFVAQTVVYTVQENLEALAENGAVPGLSVLFAAQHVTVLPLHALAACAIATLLGVASRNLRQTRRVSALLKVLVSLLGRRPTVGTPAFSEPAAPHRRITFRRHPARAPPLGI